MAHFKLLQHPLRKTKGSVLLSTVKYTHPPCSTSALPQSPQPDMCSSLTPEQPSWAMGRAELHSRTCPTAQERGFLPGTPCLGWCKSHPGHGAQTRQGGGSSDAAHAVWIPSECYLLRAGIFILHFSLTSHKLQNSWQGNVYREPISQQFASTCLCLQSILHCFHCLGNWLCYQRKLLAAFCTIYLR